MVALKISGHSVYNCQSVHGYLKRDEGCGVTLCCYDLLCARLDALAIISRGDSYRVVQFIIVHLFHLDSDTVSKS